MFQPKFLLLVKQETDRKTFWLFHYKIYGAIFKEISPTAFLSEEFFDFIQDGWIPARGATIGNFLRAKKPREEEEEVVKWPRRILWLFLRNLAILYVWRGTMTEEYRLSHRSKKRVRETKRKARPGE